MIVEELKCNSDCVYYDSENIEHASECDFGDSEGAGCFFFTCSNCFSHVDKVHLVDS